MDKQRVAELIEAVVEAALDAGSQGPAEQLWDVGDKRNALRAAVTALYAELGIPEPSGEEAE